MNPNISENTSKVQEILETNGCLHPTEDRIAKFDEMISAVEGKSQHKPIFHPHTFNELLAMPSKIWLLDQVFGAGDIGMIYGAPGCGKTFVIIDMIIRLCNGNQWANRFNVKHRLHVAYCAGEGISGLPSRFQAAAKHHDVVEMPNFTFYNTMPQLYVESRDSDIMTIKQFVHQWQERQLKKEVEALDVIVIDTLHTATTEADENSAKDMGKVLRLCRWAATELGCAVILVHHTNKSGASERGSSALRGGLDFMIKIEKTSDVTTHAVMSSEKLKDGERWIDQSFSLQSQSACKSAYVSWNDPGNLTQIGSNASNKEKLKGVMNRYAGTRLTCNRLAESIAQSPAYTRKLLNELEQTKECQRELSNPEKPQSNRNPWVYWIDAVQEMKDLND